MRPGTRIGALLGCVGLAAALLTVSAPSRAGEEPGKAGGPTAEAPSTQRRPHPLYDDHGALDWRTELDEALQLARQRRKLVFIEYGRET